MPEKIEMMEIRTSLSHEANTARQTALGEVKFDGNGHAVVLPAMADLLVAFLE